MGFLTFLWITFTRAWRRDAGRTYKLGLLYSLWSRARFGHQLGLLACADTRTHWEHVVAWRSRLFLHTPTGHASYIRGSYIFGGTIGI